MPKWLKVVLSVMVVLVLMCLAASGATYLWLDKNKDQLKASGDAAKKEGHALAQTTDAEGCVDEALRRLTTASGIVDQAVNNLFLEACLDDAPQPAKFCDGAPALSEYVLGAQWTVGRCAAKGRGQDQACGRLMQVVQKRCTRK
jgi:hypothetical protein